MKTVSQLISWLNSPDHIKCTLVDISNVVTNIGANSTTTIKLSSTIYNDSTGPYVPIIAGGLSFSETLSVDGNISSGFGSLELTNTGGTYDYFLSYIWKRRPVKIYLGDINWNKEDFVLIFDGIIDDLVSSNESTLVISLFDKLQRLNDTISEINLSSTSYSQNTEQTLLPLLFGECFNVQPLLVDNGSSLDGGQVYMYHNGEANGIIEVRDNGFPVEVDEYPVKAKATFTATINSNVLILSNFTVGTISAIQVGQTIEPITGIPADTTVLGVNVGLNAVTMSNSATKAVSIVGGKIYGSVNEGTFTLITAPKGTITCSAQGYTPYTNTIAGIITALVKDYGIETNRFTDSEISFSSFTNTSQVGIYIKDRTNILEACAQLAKSVNSGLVCPSIDIDSNGNVSASKLKLVQLIAPQGTPKYTFTDSSMVEGTLSISQTFPIRTALKLAYCKNYTLQTSTAAGLNPTINFSQEYLFVDNAITATSLQTLYKDSGTVEPEDTLLIDESEATTELNKRITLWTTQRYLITATYLPEFIFVQLGDNVMIQSNRFNLNNVKPGIVYSISRDWLTGMVEIGVLV